MTFGIGKRRPELPRAARPLESASKSEILEAAWHLAALANDSDSSDDADATARRLLLEVNLVRKRIGRGEIKI